MGKRRKKRRVFYGINKDSQGEEENEEEENREENGNNESDFVSGRERLYMEQKEKGIKSGGNGMRRNSNSKDNRDTKRKQKPFNPPSNVNEESPKKKQKTSRKNSDGKKEKEGEKVMDPFVEELLQNPEVEKCDPRMVEMICNEILDRGRKITWSDIAGLDEAKKSIKEIVIWPMLRPDVFKGLRAPPKGLLLFGTKKFLFLFPLFQTVLICPSCLNRSSRNRKGEIFFCENFGLQIFFPSFFIYRQ